MIHFPFKMLNKRQVDDMFQRKVDSVILCYEMKCFYLTMLNINNNSQYTFLLLSESNIARM